MRRFLLLIIVAGCGIDESGLLDVTPDSSPDVSSFDAPFATDAGVDAPIVDATPDTTTVDVAIDAPPEASIDAGVEAGPILTITGGSYTLLGLDAGLCSQSGNTATSFQLTNDRDASIDLVWVDYSCAEQAYGTFAPLGGKTQGTYVTHVWRIRNDADKAFLAGFVLNSASTFNVTVH